MYKLSDKEATSIIVNSSQPVAWVALSSTSKFEITEALATRAYAAVSCRNPLLRGVYEPEKAKYSLVIRDVSDIVRDEAEGKLPVHITRAFHTRDEAWAEYVRIVENERWVCRAMWEVTVCVLDRATSSDPAYVIISHFNHGVADGAAVMAALGEFVRVLNAGLAMAQASEPSLLLLLPSHNVLGESRPIPRPLLERYPLCRFVDTINDPVEKEDLYSRAVAALVAKDGKLKGMIVDKNISAEATKAFVARCKGAGVSVTAGLYAAVAMAMLPVKKFSTDMPLSFRTKDNFGDIAVSFGDNLFSLDLTDTWEAAKASSSIEGSDDNAVWAAYAKVFHGKIRSILADPEVKYMSASMEFAHGAVEPVPPLRDTLCTNAAGDEFNFCISNVGVVDGYFEEEEEEEALLSPTEVTAYCTNQDSPTLVFWCFTFRGRFHISILDITPPDRREVFEVFANKAIKIIEGN